MKREYLSTERGSQRSMASLTKTGEPRVVIIPKEIKQTTPPGGSGRGRKPHVLTILLSLLALIALVHLLAVMHGAAPTAAPATCQGLMRTTDYTQMVHLQPKSQEMGAIQFVNQLVGGQPAA